VKGELIKSLLAVIFAFHGLFFQPVSAENKRLLRAAVVKIDITPDHNQWLGGYNERKSIGVHDHIYNRILALDDGVNQFFLVSTESVSMSPAQYDQVAARLNQELGIKPVNFWWALTHTHSAPRISKPGIFSVFKSDVAKQFDSVYAASVEQKLLVGIAEAIRNLAPARLGVGWGFSNANINRRAVGMDGIADLGMYPDGAVDRRIGLIKIEKNDGSPLALIANYPIHGTVLGKENLLISGDVQGIVSEYVEKKIGAPLLFINGAAGNLGPIYSQYVNPQKGHLDQFNVMLGDKILDAYQKISTTADQVRLKTGSLIVETPRKQGLDWPLELSNYNRVTNAGEKFVRIPIRFLNINDEIAIWSAPLELFCEISNEIRDRSPFPYTFYFGYTNGSLGYMPTETEWEYKGYEPSVSPFTPSAGKDLIEGVLNHLQGKNVIIPVQ
jgi:hypothetical protein